ncbi:sugar transferase [Kiritimatiella glycovorans]|uniref:Putative sugar transferase EpsL n=1 Tax=Kiritimatiella glycovorans TaxID=1307763 RepID=A0A0G3EDE4_9BACT|nr:sugar transferase [Kiritimatiella glycovorans]AKJ64496.1 putative sugar transferase EpsL [Kiritimatiella glycovorans]
MPTDSVYRARRDLFDQLNVPMNKADIKRLRRRQRIRLKVWEATLNSLLVFKRLLDVAFSLVALVLLLPVFAAVAAAIVLEDGRPVLYVQNRVGLDGRVFRFYKFRSMYRNADEIKKQLAADNESGDGVIFKMKKDPRVTRIGRILRKFSIDEMPQFINVLMGDLSVVGPRPPLPDEVAQYSLEERKRLHVKPGLTCLWQIKGRSEIPFHEQVRLDLEYIRSRSLWNDVLIILKTVPAVLLGKGAY